MQKNHSDKKHLSISEMKRIAMDIKASYPGLYDMMTNPQDYEKDERSRATGGLYRYLREDEPSLAGKTYGEISTAQIDMISFFLTKIDMNWVWRFK